MSNEIEFVDLPQDVFLKMVKDYITENPTVGARVADYVAAGIEASRQQLLEQASDMESALSQSLFRRFFKGKVKTLTEEDKFIIEKISKWKELKKSFIRWDWLFEALEAVQEKE